MPVKTMKIALVLGLCCLVSIDGRHRLQRQVTKKIHHKYRPVKDSALLEKPTEQANSESEELPYVDNAPFDFDLGDLLNHGKKGSTQIRELFSDVWAELFGSSNSTQPESDSGRESPEEESFFHGILDLMKPWWKGPNVCMREEESEEEESDDDNSNFLSSLLTSCQDYGEAYKCTMKIGRGGKIIIRTLTYECCHGWSRQSGGRGCAQAVELSDMTSTLRQMNLTAFIDTMTSIGLNAKLAEGNFTVFAPTNAALAAVSDSEEISFVLLDTGDKMQFVREILLGHILSGWEYSHQWSDEMTLPTEKEGSSLRINFYAYPKPFTTVNCARILSTNKQTLGGLIHTVDKVIMPARQSIWEIMGQDQRFSTFSSIVSEELQEKLMDANIHFTLLAFTDEEFDKLPTDLKRQIRNKEGCFQDFAEQLVIPHTICSGAIQSDAVVRNLAGKLVNASLSDEAGPLEGAVKFQGVPVMAPDRIATNGVIHIMNGVIMLDHMMSAVELARNKNGDAFTFLLEASGLDEALPETQTLFVPINSALSISNLTETTTPSERRDILKNHVVSGEVVLSRRAPDFVVTTEAGRAVPVRIRQSSSFWHSSPATATVGCARVIRANVRGCNGLIHFIDRVLSIPRRSVMDILRGNEDLSEFVSLVEMAGLDSELNAENFTGTVLAPTNDAMEAHLSPELKEKLLKEPQKLRLVLRQHILKVPVCCHGFGSRSWFERSRYETLAGNYLIGASNGHRKRIGGAFITQCDNEATNGIIHVVDRPIIRRRATSILDIFSRGNRNFNWNLDWPF